MNLRDTAYGGSGAASSQARHAVALYVMKFGGTSVADIDKVRRAADRVIEKYDQGHECVVVVSAMGKTTDGLVKMAQEISGGKPPTREMDVLLSTGEQISIAMLSMAMHARGRDSISLTGGQVGILTDNVHGYARIREVNTSRIRQHLNDRHIVIVAGFQGTTFDNNITTLGRGGSDLTAVALAAALNAEVCEIYTDVEGVYTTDPRIVPEARKLKRITYDEMLELATQGARVLHNRAVELAKNYRVTLHVRSSFNPNNGTLVSQEYEQMEDIIISGVAFRRHEAKITIQGVPDHPGVASQVFGALADASVPVDMIIQNLMQDGENDIGFTVNHDVVDEALAVCEQVAKELKASGGVLCERNVAKVSAVGVGMQSHTHVASTMFRALAKADINIHSITTSEIKISVLIDESKVDKAVQAVHDEFELAKARF